jgi:hypothetical protein
MKGQRRFTSTAADKIRCLLVRTRTASRADQKVLRQEIRDRGFYISDFSRPATGFRRGDFDDLVRTGQIVVVRPIPMASRSVSADERAELEALIGTGEHLTRAVFQDVGDVVRLTIEIEPQELAPIVSPDQPTPDAPRRNPERVVGEGSSQEDALISSGETS